MSSTADRGLRLSLSRLRAILHIGTAKQPLKTEKLHHYPKEVTGKSLHHTGDQTGDTFIYFLCNKDGPHLRRKEVRNGRKNTSFPDEETMGPMQSLQTLQGTSRVPFPKLTLRLTPSSLMSRARCVVQTPWDL